MTDNKRRLDRIVDPAFLEGLQSRTTDEVRTMRAECQDEEGVWSYERRMVHGRLAILRKELDRRAGNDTGSIIDDLPQILSDEGRGSNRGSFPGSTPNINFDKPSRRVSKLLSDDTLANLSQLSDEQIRTNIASLEEVESEVSTTRRSVLDVLDVLNHEIARRYQTGEADPNDVLTGR